MGITLNNLVLCACIIKALINLQYYYHVSELSVCFSYFLSTHTIVIQNTYTDEDW